VTPVTVGDVVKCAKPACKSCHGTGAVASWVYLDANNQTRKEEVCRCARKRFLKKHSAEIVIEGERDWKWKDPNPEVPVGLIEGRT
jgi:hypothetical protein